MKTSKILLTVALSAVVFSAGATPVYLSDKTAVTQKPWMWQCTATGKTTGKTTGATQYQSMGTTNDHRDKQQIKTAAVQKCQKHNTTCSVTCTKMSK